MPARKAVAAGKASAKNTKQFYKNMVFVLVGELREGITHAHVERWINNRGGTVEKKITESTNFLVTTIELFTKGHPEVLKAKGLKKNRCKIVAYDWIEDCLTASKIKFVAPKNYELRVVLARSKKALAAQKTSSVNYASDGKQFEDLADPERYHIYTDPGLLRHWITLTRIQDLSDMSGVETYFLFLLESNAKPPLYRVGAKYRMGKRPSSFWKERCFDQTFDLAFVSFKWFFWKQTGIYWDQRCDGIPPMAGKFRYLVPIGGKPLGVLPMGWADAQAAREEKMRAEKEGYESELEEEQLVRDPEQFKYPELPVNDDGAMVIWKAMPTRNKEPDIKTGSDCSWEMGRKGEADLMDLDLERDGLCLIG